jgi:hypothetical protein
MSQENCFRCIRLAPIETLMLVWQRLLVAFVSAAISGANQARIEKPTSLARA